MLMSEETTNTEYPSLLLLSANCNHSSAVSGLTKVNPSFINIYLAFLAAKSARSIALFLSSSAYYLHEYTELYPVFHYIIIGLCSIIGSILLFNVMSKIPFIRWSVLGLNNSKNKIN